MTDNKTLQQLEAALDKIVQTKNNPAQLEQAVQEAKQHIQKLRQSGQQ